MNDRKIRVLMFPKIQSVKTGFESGIRRVVESYHKYSNAFGIEYVDCYPQETQGYDLLAVHAGMANRYVPGKPLVSHCHGLYFTGDYLAESWEWKGNKDVIDSLRHAYAVTVPSEWVADALRRDMHLDPLVVPHGIDWQDWQHDYPNDGYVLWNKNRHADVCDPTPLIELVQRYPKVQFMSTLTVSNPPGNLTGIGIIAHEKMKRVVQGAGVYLSTTKETFGIGVLEALAAGVPVLGYAHGGNLITVQHGVCGYLARPNDLEDLGHGLEYCLEHRDELGKNAQVIAKRFTWDKAMVKVRQAYDQALSIFDNEHRPMKL